MSLHSLIPTLIPQGEGAEHDENGLLQSFAFAHLGNRAALSSSFTASARVLS